MTEETKLLRSKYSQFVTTSHSENDNWCSRAAPLQRLMQNEPKTQKHTTAESSSIEQFVRFIYCACWLVWNNRCIGVIFIFTAAVLGVHSFHSLCLSHQPTVHNQSWKCTCLVLYIVCIHEDTELNNRHNIIHRIVIKTSMY